MALPPLLLAADLDQARDWTSVIRRSHTIELLASLDLPTNGVEGLEEALDARPTAAVAVWAAGEREATRVAERLVAHGGPCLLHPPPIHPPLGTGVQVAHGWLTLSGVGALERLFRSRSVESVRLTVRGVPEGPTNGIGPALYHAATLVSRLGREIEITGAVLRREDELALDAKVDGIPWAVEVHCHGSELRLIARTAEGDYAWTADGVSETLQRPRAEARAIPATPWAERCVRQLESPVRGADLKDARHARDLMDEVELVLERRLPPSRFEIGSTEHNLAALGLAGELPDAAPLAPRSPPSSGLPLEALAYALDLKPAVFLTVAPQHEAMVREALPGHVERAERRVDVRSSDRWIDDRSAGEPRVELYAARDAETVRRLRQLQTTAPSDALTQIGAILGYPACCVQAFAAIGDRSDNSYNRVAAAARTSVGGAWPAVLDDTALKLLPHFVCTYRCERSVEQSRQLLDALSDEHPELRAEIDAYLAGPVLYFDHDHQLHFRGRVSGPAVSYSAVSIPWSSSEPFAKLGGVIAQGDRLVLSEDRLTVHAGSAELLVLRRVDPHLGILMPFSRQPG